MIMQQAIPVDSPIVLMMLCSRSLRSNLKANMKKLESISISDFGSWNADYLKPQI
jgi:hypothetical protein